MAAAGYGPEGLSRALHPKDTTARQPGAIVPAYKTRGHPYSFVTLQKTALPQRAGPY